MNAELLSEREEIRHALQTVRSQAVLASDSRAWREAYETLRSLKSQVMRIEFTYVGGFVVVFILAAVTLITWQPITLPAAVITFFPCLLLAQKAAQAVIRQETGLSSTEADDAAHAVGLARFDYRRLLDREKPNAP